MPAPEHSGSQRINLSKSDYKLLSALGARFHVPELAESQEALARWFNTPFGRTLVGFEAEACKQISPRTPGYRAAQLAVSPDCSLMQGFTQQHKFTLTARDQLSGGCVCDFKRLPLPSDSIDAFLLHHVLDFTPEPHEVLGEVARTVAPGGHIVVIGFNPYSFFGMSKWVAGLFSSQQVWRHNSLRKSRVVDWLRLLGFKMLTVQVGGTPTPVTNLSDRDSSRIVKRATADAFYVLFARKQATPLTPVRHPRWASAKVHPVPGLRAVGDNCRRTKRGSNQN